MKQSRLVNRAIAWAGVMLTAVVALLGMAAQSNANADVSRFWEEEARPSITGRAPKSAGKIRSARGVRDARDADEQRTSRGKRRNTRVASLGGDDAAPRPSRRSVTGGGVSWVASSGCLNGTLRGLVDDVAASYGGATVSSTCRSKGHNASVGGAKHSQHLTGDAVDFRVHGNVSGAIAYLRNHGSVGGFHHYGGGLVHIDTGPRRTW
jgi:hypothetical protein